MSADKKVASDVPPRYLFFLIAITFIGKRASSIWSHNSLTVTVTVEASPFVQNAIVVFIGPGTTLYYKNKVEHLLIYDRWSLYKLQFRSGIQTAIWDGSSEYLKEPTTDMIRTVVL